MGVDYGRRRIGVSVTDESGRFVRPICCINTAGDSDGTRKLCETIDCESPSMVVFGLPLGPAQEETAVSREIRGIAEKVSRACNRPVRFVDESYTSAEAQKIVRGRPRKKRRDKSAVDRIAACLILEQYIKENT